MLLTTAPEMPPLAEDLEPIIMQMMNFGMFIATIAAVIMMFKFMFRFLLYGPMWTPRPRREREEVKVTAPAPPGTARPAAGAIRVNLATVEAAGRKDMLHAWFRWAFQADHVAHQKIDLAALDNYLAAHPTRHMTQMRMERNGRNLWALRDAAADHGKAKECEDRLKQFAARISDYRGDQFDTMEGLSNQSWLVHENTEKRSAYREAYLAGGAKAVDEIAEAIQRGREDVRAEIEAEAARDAIVAASNAQLENVARERTARLAALRETHQPTASLDAHQKWLREAGELES